MRLKSKTSKMFRNILTVLLILLVLVNNKKLGNELTIFLVGLLLFWLFIYNSVSYGRLFGDSELDQEQSQDQGQDQGQYIVPDLDQGQEQILSR